MFFNLLKIFLIMAISYLVFSHINLNFGKQQQEQADAQNLKVYRSNDYNFEISYPQSFNLNVERGDLINLSNDEVGQVRVNVGCYGSGVETVSPNVNLVDFGGHDALEAVYTVSGETVRQEVSFNYNNLCYMLEMMPVQPGELKKLREISQTFRIIEE